MKPQITKEAAALIGRRFGVLDHGFVRLIDVMGNDAAIVQAARVSYGEGTKTFREDQGLINYLIRNKHTSPLEQVIFKFHMKLPIFIARQIVRHRTASLNELSLRYSEAEDDFYLPGEWRAQDTSNKQGSVKAKLDHESLSDIAEKSSLRSMQDYRSLLVKGGAREMARMVLPVNLYTQWYWTMDLHNLFHFLRLRLDSHAQHENREYAKVVAKMVKAVVPIAYMAFEDHVLNAVTLSGPETAWLQDALKEKGLSVNDLFDDEHHTDKEKRSVIQKLGKKQEVLQ